MITTEDIQNLANLARIEVADNETESIRKKMEGVLEYVFRSMCLLRLMS